jgi:small subunit ribosomal protein S18
VSFGFPRGSSGGGGRGPGGGGRPGGPGGARGAGGDRGGAGGKEGGKRFFFRRRKVCKFCADKIDYVDYKDVKLLSGFVPERGKILPRRMFGTCAEHQRKLTVALKRARNIALLPFAAE